MSIYRLLFFFFKQKTAYEMRISDWSSDVCSSDLEKKIKPASWGSMDNEAVIADLCAIRGIGRWTAAMFLIFNLQRPDVLPLDDATLLKAISLHSFSGEPVSRFEAREDAQDRNSVVMGKGLSIRVGLGVSKIMKK